MLFLLVFKFVRCCILQILFANFFYLWKSNVFIMSMTPLENRKVYSMSEGSDT